MKNKKKEKRKEKKKWKKEKEKKVDYFQGASCERPDSEEER